MLLAVLLLFAAVGSGDLVVGRGRLLLGSVCCLLSSCGVCCLLCVVWCLPCISCCRLFGWSVGLLVFLLSLLQLLSPSCWLVLLLSLVRVPAAYEITTTVLY